MLHRPYVALLLVGLSLASARVGAAQQLNPGDLAASVQQVDASRFPSVLAYVGALDERGLPLANLGTDAFSVTEDGRPVQGVQITPVSDAQVPVAIGLVLDVSGSMNDDGKLDAAKLAADSLVDSLGPSDAAAVVGFDGDVRLVQPFTSDHAALHGAVDGLQAQGNTTLYDAIQQSSLLLQAVPQQRRVLLVCTDGIDTASRGSLNEALDAAKGVRGVIMPIGVGPDVDRGVLDQLAQSTGGSALYPAGPDDLPASFRSALGQLRSAYALRYTSARLPDGQPHTVSVSVAFGGAQATASGTYVAQKPPTLSFSVAGIAAADVVSNPRQIDVNVQAGSLQRLEVLLDGQLLGNAAGSPTSLSVLIPSLAAGQHELLIRGTDGAGAPITQTLRVSGPEPIQPPPPPPPPPVPEPTPDWVVPMLLGVFAVLAVGLGYLLWLARPRRDASAVEADDDDRTLDLDGVVAPAPQPSLARLQVAHGSETHEVALTGTELLIGRDPTNAIALQDLLVSRRHARIVLDGDMFWIEDLHSRNGTILNDRLPISRHHLQSGDRITIGTTTLIFVQQQPAATTSSQIEMAVPPASGVVLNGAAAR